MSCSLRLSSRRLFALGAALCLLAAGCSETPPITSYEVHKEPVPQTDRILGAIVPRGEQAWFFKITGDAEQVGSVSDRFHEFLQSLRFEGKGPEWELPPNWEQLPADGLRFATIRIPIEKQPAEEKNGTNKSTEGTGEKSIELTVSQLPWRGGDEDSQIVANVNRWRDQLGLGRIGRSTLDVETSRLEFRDGVAIVVNVVGKLKPSDMKMPMAGSQPSRRPTGPPPTIPGSAKSNLPFDFETPEGWERSQGSSLSVVAFRVAKDGQQIETTVTPLSATAGELVPNVNRWRGQVGLPSAGEQEIRDSVKKIRVGDKDADYVELLGPEGTSPRKAILGAILVANDFSWFVKATGDADLAQQEKEHFEQFVKSIRFR